ncbi:MAG: hypothetical protein LUH45_03865, partial [Clostridiales bacterium]|nr:hypothetical protein [Clostridiales bacterium]
CQRASLKKLLQLAIAICDRFFNMISLEKRQKAPPRQRQGGGKLYIGSYFAQLPVASAVR